MREAARGRSGTIGTLGLRRREPRISARTPIATRAPLYARAAAWALRRAALYAQLPLQTPRAGMVLFAGAPSGNTFVDARSRHLQTSLRWAPRLHFTLVERTQTQASPEREATATAGWRLLRAVERVHRASSPPPGGRRGPVAVRSALLLRERVETRLQPVESVVMPGRGSVATTPATVAPVGVDRPEIGFVPARPIARVLHEAAVDKPGAGAQLPRPNQGGGESEPPPSWQRPAPHATMPLESDPAALDRISERVMQQIGQRIQSYRERTGRL